MPYLVGFQTPQDYGAAGNGVQDDTTFINNAMSTLQAAGGGTLFFPPGTYKLTNPIIGQPLVSMLGAGANNTILNQTNTSANGVLYNPNSSFTGTSIMNLTINGPGSGAGIGLIMESNLGSNQISSCSVENVEVTGFGGGGILMNKPVACSIDTCFVNNCGGGGIALNNGGTGNVVTNCYSSSVNWAYSASTTIAAVFEGCYAFGSGGGFLLLSTTSCKIINCSADTIVAAGTADGSGFEVSSGNANSLDFCYSNINKAVAFNIIGSATNVTLSQPVENAPSGATNSITVASGSTATVIGATTVTATNFTGQTTRIIGGALTATGTVAIQPTASGNTSSSINVGGTSAFDQFRQLGNGQMAFGTGAAARDAFITHAGTNTLSINPNLLVGSQTALGDNGSGEIQLADATTKPTSAPTGGLTIFSQSASALPLIAFTPGGSKLSMVDATFVLTGSPTTFTSASQTATTVALAVESSATYLVEQVAIFSNTTGNTTFSWTGPASATMQWNDTTASLDYTSTIGGLGFVWPSNAGTRFVIHKGYLVTSGTAGTLTLTVAVSAGTTTLQTGTYLRLTRIK